MLLASEAGKRVTEALLSDRVDGHTSEVNLAEAEYVLCRKLGSEAAKQKLNDLRDSNYLTIVDTEQTSRIAAEIKCHRSISLADCYTLATAKATGLKALFAMREKELLREIKKHPYDGEIVFLEDLTLPPTERPFLR
jgi:predicted nucleic acid-binding protein